jgi:glyoxylase-like metal-dependent hydrolase (beta-lactamase superfamily II)
MREIVSDILTWSWFSEPHGYDFNGHLIRDPSGNICIDPVEPTGDDFDAIVREGVTRILLTNRNHSRAANRLRARSGAKTAIHADDADHARGQETGIDEEFKIADKIGPLEVIEAAGKSPGEVALFWRERGILIVGDAVIGNPPGSLGLLPERVMDDPSRLRRSVRGFLNLDFDTLLVGDGVSILDDAKARLRELADTFPS